MYIVSKYDYKKKSIDVINRSSMRNSIAFMESYICNYLENNQGNPSSTEKVEKKDYRLLQKQTKNRYENIDDYTYSFMNSPDLNRFYDASNYYVVKSNPEENIFALTVKRKDKIYSYIPFNNSFSETNLITLYLFYDGENKINKYINKEFDKFDEFHKVLFQLMHIEEIPELSISSESSSETK